MATFSGTACSASLTLYVGSGICFVKTGNEQTPFVRGQRAQELKKQGLKPCLFCFLVSLAAEISKPFVKSGNLSFCAYTRCCPVQAGWFSGSIDRRISSPGLPQVDLVVRLVPSVITNVIS